MSKLDVRHITVADDDDGQRFERWIKKNLPELPYGLAQKLIRKGQFRIDGKRAKPDTKLVAGQDIRVPPFEYRAQRSEKRSEQRLTEKDVEFIRNMIIFDDGDIIAIDKPADLPVQGGSKIEYHLDKLLPALVNREGVVPRLVHRLDKDTSGVLLLARSAKVAKSLGELFKSREMRKTYWALVNGVPDPRDGTIKAHMIKSGGTNRERMTITDHNDKEGKYSQTEYSVIDHAHKRAAFVAFWPRTGRTHQLRVHAELLGTPIIGDYKYAGQHLEEPPEPIEGIERPKDLHLHAHRLVFKHPVTGKKMDIKAPLPPALQKTWKALGFETSTKDDPFINVEN